MQLAHEGTVKFALQLHAPVLVLQLPWPLHVIEATQSKQHGISTQPHTAFLHVHGVP